MNVSLTPELERLVQEKVTSGLYSSASEVVREALRLLQERDELRRIRLDELRKEIAIGLAEADRGELLDGEQVMAELRRELQLRLAQDTPAKQKG
jgi:antitoxin ParD1/3/4